MPTREQITKWESIISIVSATIDNPVRRSYLTKLELVDVRDQKVIGRFTDLNPMTRNTFKATFLQTLDVLVMTTFGSSYRFELLDPGAASPEPRQKPSTLNPKYTFESFIQGDSNKFAYAAALSVAELPGRSYNPLFIYGDVGLGKTHLMNAIGNYAHANDPDLRIRFITSENMTNELIERLRGHGSMDELRSELREVDILLVDDIQFLSKTASTQEEFFNTFNELHQHGKQIVISSDRPPRELPTIEDRLRSRFEWGLIVDIKKPDFETRMAILRNKAEEDGIGVDDDVMRYIAQTCTGSIRALEGALNRLKAHSEMMHLPIDMELAQKELEGLVRTPQRDITVKVIQQQVSDFFDISVEELRGKKRTADIARARHLAIYLSRQLTDKSTTFIGNEFGGRDHSTVMSAITKITNELQSNEDTRATVRSLEEKIRGI